MAKMKKRAKLSDKQRRENFQNFVGVVLPGATFTFTEALQVDVKEFPSLKKVIDRSLRFAYALESVTCGKKVKDTNQPYATFMHEYFDQFYAWLEEIYSHLDEVEDYYGIQFIVARMALSALASIYRSLSDDTVQWKKDFDTEASYTLTLEQLEELSGFPVTETDLNDVGAVKVK